MRDDRQTPEIARVLERLDKVKRSGQGWAALCPSHRDRDPSLSVSLGSGDKVIVNCHRGCTAEDIVGALGLEMQDMWPPDSKVERRKKEWVENYDYVDAEGTLIFQVTRWMDEGRKTFTQRRPIKGGAWEYSTTGIEKPLYRLPQIIAAMLTGEPIYLAEGEKDVHALEAVGVTATTMPGGAGSWLPRYTRMLKGASQVFVIPDRDAVGMKHAQRVQAELEFDKTPAKVIGPPEGHHDVFDFFETGGTVAGFVDIDFDDENLDPFTEVLTELRGITGHETWSLEKKLQRARAIIDNTQFDPTDGAGRLIRWDAFLREPVEEYDWVIPGLLERSERVIVVAAEGIGKTMLARQMALMCAAGIHPFKKDRMKPVTTLYVDLENPERIIRRTSRKIMERIRWFKDDPFLDIPAHIFMKPDGINIFRPEDRVLLERIIAQTEPDILFLGPLYKSFIDPGGGRTPESVTIEVATFFDYIRDHYQCALWLEHHAPFGSSQSGRELRPIGSTVWQRWPEFGIALSPDPTQSHYYDLKHFRGAREEREWPVALFRGEIWPFEAVWGNH